jgi:hypothetical protein
VHPYNRHGQVISGTRCSELLLDIATSGFDAHEANQWGVVIEGQQQHMLAPSMEGQQPQLLAPSMEGQKPQLPEMLVYSRSLRARREDRQRQFGSLNRSHMNQVFNDINAR